MGLGGVGVGAEPGSGMRPPARAREGTTEAAMVWGEAESEWNEVRGSTKVGGGHGLEDCSAGGKTAVRAGEKGREEDGEGGGGEVGEEMHLCRCPTE